MFHWLKISSSTVSLWIFDVLLHKQKIWFRKFTFSDNCTYRYYDTQLSQKSSPKAPDVNSTQQGQVRQGYQWLTKVKVVQNQGQARVPVTNKARTPVTNKGQSSPKPKATITGCAEQPSAGCAVGYSANARCLLSGQISARCLFRGVYSSLFQYIPIDKKLPFLAHFIKN